MSKAVQRWRPGGLLITFLLTLCMVFTGFVSAPQAHAASTDLTPGVYWPQNQKLPTFSRPMHLDVVNLQKGPGEVSLMMASLEGIVNRGQPRIYLLEHIHDEGVYTWLNDMRVPYEVYQDPWKVVSKYAREAKGIIIYDPNLLDTTNAATTLAGLRNGIVASPALANRLKAAPYHLPILEDLRGKFANRLDMVNWEIEHLWPKTTHRMLIGLNPTTSVPVPDDNWKDFQTVQQVEQPVINRSNRAVYDLDLSSYLGGNAVYVRFEDSYRQDGWGPSVHQVTVKADGNIIAQFIGCGQDEEQYIFDHGGSSCDLNPSNAHRFADGKSYFVYRFVPPAGTRQLVVSVDMWNEFKVSASKLTPQASSDQQTPYGYLRDYAVANRAMVFWLSAYKTPKEVALFDKIASLVKPGTPYLGWFDSEPDGVRITSRHAIPVLAADWFSNMTVHSGMRAPSQPIKQLPAPTLENKIYVTFVISDGDNLQYDEHYMRTLWDDPNRGKVPLNWSISPLIVDAAPFILNHYQKTASRNDLLIAGPSGAGYFYPSLWPQNNLNTYFEQSEVYMRKLGTDIVYGLDTQQMPPTAVAQAYQKQMHLNGLFYNATSQSSTTTLNGMPVSVQLGAGTHDQMVAAIQKNAANWDGNSPLFISVQLVAWNETPTDALYIAQHLGAHYDVVRGDQFFQLYRKANGLPAAPARQA